MENNIFSKRQTQIFHPFLIRQNFKNPYKKRKVAKKVGSDTEFKEFERSLNYLPPILILMILQL